MASGLWEKANPATVVIQVTRRYYPAVSALAELGGNAVGMLSVSGVRHRQRALPELFMGRDSLSRPDQRASQPKAPLATGRTITFGYAARILPPCVSVRWRRGIGDCVPDLIPASLETVMLFLFDRLRDSLKA